MSQPQPKLNPLQMQIVNHFNGKMLEQKKIYETSTGEINKLTQSLPKLIQQIHENELTKGKLGILDEDSKLFKSSGPCLIPQTKEEVLSNVESRLDAYNKSLKATEENIKKLKEKQKECSDYVMRLQDEMQKALQQTNN